MLVVVDAGCTKSGLIYGPLPQLLWFYSTNWLLSYSRFTSSEGPIRFTMHPYSGTTDGILLWLVLPAGIPVTPLEPLRFFTNGPQGIQHSNQYNSSYRVHTDCFSSFLVFHQGRSSPPHYASVPDSTGTQTSRSSSSNLVLDCCIYFYLDTIVSIVSIVTYRIQSPSRHRSISLSRISYCTFQVLLLVIELRF